MKPLLMRSGVKLRLSVAACVLALSLLGAARATNVPSHQEIVPGVRIGRVALGASQKTVRRLLGAPFKSLSLRDGLRADVWRAPKPNCNGTFHTLEAIYRRGVVVQIEATNPAYRTQVSTGLSTDFEVGDWVRAYGSQRSTQGSKPKLPAIYNLEETSYRYTKRNPAMLKYFDWVQRGVAIETQVASVHEDDDYQIIRSVIVHRPQFRVLPDAGGKRMALAPTATGSSDGD